MGWKENFKHVESYGRTTALAGIPMLVMGFTSPTTPIMIYFVALTFTGIAESFRSVSITPAAQSMLEPKRYRCWYIIL